MERNIINNAYFLIHRLNQEGIKDVTQLKVQKLMYLTECLFCIENKQESMFDDTFLAWTYGPFSKNLYQEFKKNGSDTIILSEYDNQRFATLPEENRRAINRIITLFGNVSASQLVKITHYADAPWSKTEIYTEISKKDSIEWFRRTFLGG